MRRQTEVRDPDTPGDVEENVLWLATRRRRKFHGGHIGCVRYTLARPRNTSLSFINARLVVIRDSVIFTKILR